MLSAISQETDKSELTLLVDCSLQIFCVYKRCCEYCLCRPRWERCGEVATGGAEFWMQATEGKTSDEIVDMLLAEIQDGSGRARGRMDYFEGLVSADVCSP